LILGCSIVEAKLAFFKKQMEILLVDYVVLSQDSLGLVPEVFNSVNVILFINENLRMIKSMMMEFTNI
jgi:hypothetical protein